MSYVNRYCVLSYADHRVRKLSVEAEEQDEIVHPEGYA